MKFYMVDIMAVFVDTGPFIAYCNEKDVNHSLSKLIFNEIEGGHYGEPVTSDYILTEALNFLFKKGGREESILLGKKIFESYHLIHIDENIFANSWDRFNKFKSFSLTDCTILSVVELYDIETVFTFDGEFKNFVKTVGLR